MTIFDSDLIAPGLANATLAGIPLRLNPQSAQLSYNIKTSQTQTVGGMVVQVYGVSLSDLVVHGVFGAGGRQEQQVFFGQIQKIAQAAVDAQRAQPNLSQVGNDVVLPTGSVPFVFPHLNYDLQVYVKGYTSLEGASVVESNANFNPSWQLTLLIENDNTGLLTTTVANNYINRVAAGLGSGEMVGGKLNQYLGSDASEISAFLASPFSGGATSLSQADGQAYGGAAGAAVAGVGSTPSAAGPSTSASGNEATIWNFFTGKGLSAASTAGIMGNLQQESGFNPQSIQPSSTSPTPPWAASGNYNTGIGYGIAQWTSAGRQKGLQDLADTQNLPVDDMQLQLTYLWQELTGSYASTLAAVKTAITPQAAASAFESGYEGGTDPGGVRESNAQTIYNTYGKGK